MEEVKGVAVRQIFEVKREKRDSNQVIKLDYHRNGTVNDYH